MSSRTVFVLLLALASGGVAGWAALRLWENQPAPLVAQEPMAQALVIVAARDLPVGTTLGEEDVRLISWPAEATPVGYTRSVPEVVGRGLIQSVRLNEPLLDAKLTGKGQNGMAGRIAEGRRAVSIRVDEVVGVAGFIDTGTRVDVLMTPSQTGTDPLTRIVLQNIEVLARGQQQDKDPEGQPMTVTVVTLLVTPQQAEQLTLATQQGRIQLALRNFIDVKEVATTGARLSQMVAGGARPRTGTGRAPTPTAQQSRTTVELYKGATRAVIRYSGGEPR